MVRLSYFAWVREGMGMNGETVTLPAETCTIAQLIDWLAKRDTVGGTIFAHPSRVRAARDGVMAGPDTAIAGAAEIALFPPVTGG